MSPGRFCVSELRRIASGQDGQLAMLDGRQRVVGGEAGFGRSQLCKVRRGIGLIRMLRVCIVCEFCARSRPISLRKTRARPWRPSRRTSSPESAHRRQIYGTTSFTPWPARPPSKQAGTPSPGSEKRWCARFSPGTISNTARTEDPYASSSRKRSLKSSSSVHNIQNQT